MALKRKSKKVRPEFLGRYPILDLRRSRDGCSFNLPPIWRASFERRAWVAKAPEGFLMLAPCCDVLADYVLKGHRFRPQGLLLGDDGDLEIPLDNANYAGLQKEGAGELIGRGSVILLLSRDFFLRKYVLTGPELTGRGKYLP